MTGYVLSYEAGQDLEEIEDYTANQWGDKQSERYLRDVFKAFNRLVKNPNIGRNRSDVPHPYLVYSVGSHMIIYRYNQSINRVEVLNVLHPAMDIHRRIKKALLRIKKRKSQ